MDSSVLEREKELKLLNDSLNERCAASLQPPKKQLAAKANPKKAGARGSALISDESRKAANATDKGTASEAEGCKAKRMIPDNLVRRNVSTEGIIRWGFCLMFKRVNAHQIFTQIPEGEGLHSAAGVRHQPQRNQQTGRRISRKGRKRPEDGKSSSEIRAGGGRPERPSEQINRTEELLRHEAQSIRFPRRKICISRNEIIGLFLGEPAALRQPPERGRSGQGESQGGEGGEQGSRGEALQVPRRPRVRPAELPHFENNFQTYRKRAAEGHQVLRESNKVLQEAEGRPDRGVQKAIAAHRQPEAAERVPRADQPPAGNQRRVQTVLGLESE